jgi:F-type H+-transporting ATPase subunit gamma
VSGTTESLRRRIAGAEDLGAVVRSMKALAASSIGQYEKAVESLDDYYRTVELGLAACFRQGRPALNGAREVPADGGAIGAVVFGSDQGLVGRFNEVLVEFATRTLRTLPGKTTKVWTVGERVRTLMENTGLTQAGPLSVPTSVGTITPLVDHILIEIEAARELGEVANVYVFHNHPKAGALYEPVGKRLLPLDRVWQSKLASLSWPTRSLPEVIEGTTPAIHAFIRGYLFVLLFQASAESLASENASRLAAMQRAEKNIGDILEELSRSFHRIRQESIDEELFDVMSGYEALSKETHKEEPAPADILLVEGQHAVAGAGGSTSSTSRREGLLANPMNTRSSAWSGGNPPEQKE